VVKIALHTSHKLPFQLPFFGSRTHALKAVVGVAVAAAAFVFRIVHRHNTGDRDANRCPCITLRRKWAPPQIGKRVPQASTPAMRSTSSSYIATVHLFVVVVVVVVGGGGAATIGTAKRESSGGSGETKL
jgi:hypothetical protein